MATQDISQLVVEVKSQGIQTAANQLGKLATAADNAEQAVKKLGTSVVGVNGMLTGGVATTAALVAAMTTLTAVLERQSQSTARATVTTRANNEAMAEAHALARGLSGSLGALWVTYGNLAGMGVGIALGASLKGIVSVGKDVEQTLEQIRVLGQASTSDMDKMGAAVSALGKGVNGPKDVAEALQVLTLAGLNAKEAMQGVGAALSLSVAGGVSIEKSAETLVQVGTALGFTADAYEHVGDVIAMTAAASMSSVDSISNAFKSAAAVGEVYGASLQDIALGLAAVANLGIQGTSAGTALKNFYKDLSASTQKVTNTLKDMHLGIKDFRDDQGFMLPLVDMVKKLDGGFNSLGQNAKKLAEVKMFSQQGVREFAVLSKMLHTASNEVDEFGNKYGSKLEEVAGQISKSAAFSTLAAIAMAQTTSAQLKGVGNTIQTVFSDVFASVQPQIGSIARSLKSAFNSDEFKGTLTKLATEIANVTKYIVEHVGALKTAAEVYAAFKVVEFATGLTKVALAFDVAAISVRGFVAALGPIAIAIAGLTWAWQMYKTAKDRALDNKPAEDNLEEYANKVREAADKELAVLEMKKKGYSSAQIAQEESIKEQVAASDRAVKTATDGVAAQKKAMDDLWNSMSAQEQRTAKLMMANPARRDQILGSGGTKFAEYQKQELMYRESLTRVNSLVEKTNKSTKELIANRTESAAIDEKNAKANRFLSTGTGTLSGKADTKGINDAYAAAIASFQNDIKAANRDLTNFNESEDAKFKAGQIGRLTVINETADKEISTYGKIAAAAKSQRDLAANTPNKQADVERFQGEIERANEQAAQSEKMRAQNTLAAQRALQVEATAIKVKALEDQGKYVDAANLKWSVDGKLALEQAQADLAKYSDKFPELATIVEAYADRRDAAINSAQLKEDTASFGAALAELQGSLKGFKAATFGTSIGTMFDTATRATAKFDVALVKAKKARDELGFDMLASGTAESVKAYEDANKEILAMTDKQKTMWVEVGETITSSLTKAFGSAGTAMGDLFKASIQYSQTENATMEDRMGQYGDMAQAASGFFDKQSKGYRALNGVAQVFHIAEMARTLVRTAASIAGGAAKFFEQSGWGGFAGIAAMGGVMAGLGYAMSGASSSGADPKLDAEYVQKHQGTGTVLGDADAKSESITKAMDDLKSNSDMMLPLTQGMLSSLKNIESAMGGLAKLSIQNGVNNGSNFDIQTGVLSKGAGGLVGSVASLLSNIPVLGGVVGKLASLWGKTSQEVTDSGLQFGGKVSDLQAGKGVDQYAAVKTSKSSWFGLSKSSSTDVKTQGAGDEISSQIGLVFSNLEDALKGAAGSLGSSSDAVAKAIDNVVLATTKISLKDLKGDELTAAINNVMSAAMDQIAKAAYPQMQAFQQVGEGYAQTVVRVASGVEQATFAMKKIGLEAVSYLDIVNKTGDVSYEIVKQTIALKEGASGVGEIMKQVSGSMSDIVSAYTELVAARKQMNNLGLGNGLSMATLTGAGDLKSLTSDLSTYYDKFFNAQEKVGIQTKSLTEQFSTFGYTLPGTREELRSWIETAAKAGDQLKVGQLLSLASGFDTLQTAIEGLDKTVDTKTDQFDADAVAKAKQAYDDALNVAETAYSRLEASVNAQKTKIESAKDVLQTTIDAVKGVLDTLSKAIKATAPKLTDIQSFQKSMKVVQDAIATVSSGGDISKVSGLDDAVEGLSNQGNTSYSTEFEYNRSQAQANAALTSLSAVGERQLTEAEKLMSVYQLQLADLDKQLETARAQLDALKGIDNSILTMNDALANFASALMSAQNAKSNYDSVTAGSTGGAGAAVESLYKTVLGRSSDAAGKAYWVDALSKGESMTNVTAGFVNSAENKSNQLDSLYKSAFGRTADAAGKDYWMNAMQSGTSMEQVASAFYNSQEYKDAHPSFDVGTNFVPNDMIANIHKGERIIPAADNAALQQKLDKADSDGSKSDSNSQVVAKLEELMGVIVTGDVANVQKTNEMFKIFREWNGNGMPPVRVDE